MVLAVFMCILDSSLIQPGLHGRVLVFRVDLSIVLLGGVSRILLLVIQVFLE